MNQQTTRVLCLFILTVLIASCSSLDFVASGKTPFKISTGNNSEQFIEIKSTADFYFWGNSPKSAVIDLEEQALKFGLEQPSAVSISQEYSVSNILMTILTLGLYCPVDYKISLMTNKGELK